MTGELNETEIRNVLTSQVTGRLACVHGRKPYIVPVTYTYNGEYIYGQTNEGMKLDIMRKNPHVCLEVDTMTDMRNWKSVVVEGIFEELKDEEAETARETLFSNVLPLMTSSTIHPHGHQVTGTVDDSNRVKYVMYRIRIGKVTGRYERQ